MDYSTEVVPKVGSQSSMGGGNLSICRGGVCRIVLLLGMEGIFHQPLVQGDLGSPVEDSSSLSIGASSSHCQTASS